MKKMSNARHAGWFLAALMASGASAQANQSTFSEISEARAEQVNVMRDKGDDAGIGRYGLRMMDLVASGYVSADKGWKDPETAVWTGKDGVSSLDDFEASDVAQGQAYDFYLQGALEHIKIQKPEISVKFDDKVMGAKDILRFSAFAKPYELVDVAVSGDVSALDNAAKRAGYDSGLELARTVMDTKDKGYELSM